MAELQHSPRVPCGPSGKQVRTPLGTSEVAPGCQNLNEHRKQEVAQNLSQEMRTGLSKRLLCCAVFVCVVVFCFSLE